MNHNIFKKASDIVDMGENAYFSYMDEKGYPHTATRSKIKSEGIMSCYFSTNLSGDMAKAIRRDSRSSVCFHSNNNNITLMGDAEIIEDLSIKKDLWIEWFINHYPDGPTDPEYCVIIFTTKSVSLWVDREIAKFDIEQLKKMTSRCGLLCQSCTYRETNNCGTCVATNGHPFYGECQIAVCCQEKNYQHCGECPNMPCSKLFDYSCGEGEHCDNPKGSRLDILRMWHSIRGEY